MTVMEYDILNAVEKIDEACLDAEARVLDAMFEEYTKIFQLTEFCDDQTVLEQFDIFAEAEDKKDDGDELTEGGFWKKKDNTFLKKVVAFIARLVQWIGRKISGSKSSDDNMKKVIDKAEEVSKSAELTPEQQEKINKALSENEAKEGETPEETNDGNIFTRNKKTFAAIAAGVLGLTAGGVALYAAKKKKGDESENDQEELTGGEQQRLENKAQDQADADKSNSTPTETSAPKQEVPVDVNKFNGYLQITPKNTKPFSSPVNLDKMVFTLALFRVWSVAQLDSTKKLVTDIKKLGDLNGQVTAGDYVTGFTDDMFKKLSKFTTRTNTTEKDVVNALKNKIFFFKRNVRYSAGDFWQILQMASSNMNTTQNNLNFITKNLETVISNEKTTENLKKACEEIDGRVKLYQDFIKTFIDIRDKMYDDLNMQIAMYSNQTTKSGKVFNAALGKYVEKGHENDTPEMKKKVASFADKLINGETAAENNRAVQRKNQDGQKS